MKTPLLVVLARVGDAPESEAYAAVLRETFVGPPTTGAGFVPRELLQAGEFREFILDLTAPLPTSFGPLLRSAERILIVVLDARATPPPVSRTLNDVETALTEALPVDDGSHAIVNVALKAPDSLFDTGPGDRRIVRLGLADLDERDLRLPFLMLYALHNALWLFARAPGGTTGASRAPEKAVRLFFSHAKRDGVPLTTAMLSWMQRLKGFDAFYDTVNLDLDGDIDAQLQQAVTNAVVVVFRTDIFDQRYWCQKEVLWAEQHGCPVVTVDARWHIEHSPSVISFDSTPVVRIPDGSVVRVLTTALGETLRIELFRSRAAMHGTNLVDTSVEVIPRCPSLVSLHEACLRLNRKASLHRFIVYPNPSVPVTLLSAAEGLAGTLVSGCRVQSLDEFRLTV